MPSIDILALPECDPGAGKCATADPAAFKFTADYLAVIVDNGQVLFGNLGQGGSDYPVPRNAFTAQTQTNPDTKEVSRALAKRSVDPHNPDYIVINARHILAVEPKAFTSRVAQVIQQAETQPAAPPTPTKP